MSDIKQTVRRIAGTKQNPSLGITIPFHIQDLKGVSLGDRLTLTIDKVEKHGSY